MQLQTSIQSAFGQIVDIMSQLSDSQYSYKSKNLFGASIGQHVRHVAELFLELDKGYAIGVVNYEKRQRDLRIETDNAFAIDTLDSIIKNLDKSDKQLLLHASYCQTGEIIEIQTNYIREIVYNLEHTIHHMALIRVGAMELSFVDMPENFGVAPSTVKYRQSCAQ